MFAISKADNIQNHVCPKSLALILGCFHRAKAWTAEPGGWGAFASPPQFLPNFCKITLFASNFGISMPTAPPPPPTFQLAPALSNSLRRL